MLTTYLARNLANFCLFFTTSVNKAAKQDDSDTFNHFSEKDQRFIKENKLVFFIQTNLPKNIYIFTA